MRKYILWILYLGILFGSSCGDGNTGTQPLREYSHEVVQTGQFEVTVDSSFGRTPQFSDICEIEGIECLAVLNGYQNSIYLFPLSGDSLPNSIPPRIQVDRAQIGNVKSFYFEGQDSIYLQTKGGSSRTPRKERELHLVNFKGELIDSILYADQITLLNTDPDALVDIKSEQLFSNQSLPLRKYKSTLFVGLLPYFREELSRPVSAHIQLETGRFSYHDLRLDSNSIGGDFVYQLATRAIDTSHTQIALGYRGSPYIQSFNWDSNSSSRHIVNSDYLSLSSPPQPFVEDSVNGSVQGISQENQLLDHGEYGRIFSSPEGYFCRIVYFANQDSLFLEKYDNRATIDNRFCSIMVFSHKFHKLGETSLGEGLIDRNAGFSKDGTFYIQDFIPSQQFRGNIRYLKYAIVERKLK